MILWGGHMRQKSLSWKKARVTCVCFRNRYATCKCSLLYQRKELLYKYIGFFVEGYEKNFVGWEAVWLWMWSFQTQFWAPYTKGEEVSDQNRMVVVWRRGYQNLQLWQVINEWSPIAEIIFGFYLWVLLLIQFLVFLNCLGLLKFNLKLIWKKLKNNLKIEIWLEGLKKDLFQVTLLFREKKSITPGIWFVVGGRIMDMTVT